MTGCFPTKQSLFSACQTWTTEIARFFCIVIASLRSNLSFLFAYDERRDRHAPLAMTGSRRAMTSPALGVFLVIASLRSNLSFLFAYDERRDRHTQRAHCAPLAMTGSRRAMTSPALGVFLVIASLRSNLSFLFAYDERRDRHVPLAMT